VPRQALPLHLSHVDPMHLLPQNSPRTDGNQNQRPTKKRTTRTHVRRCYEKASTSCKAPSDGTFVYRLTEISSHNQSIHLVSARDYFHLTDTVLRTVLPLWLIFFSLSWLPNWVEGPFSALLLVPRSCWTWRFRRSPPQSTI
jgi:hypothetical protein